jgi:tripartite-type tricarboxylate transporter receptor subunit TctC
MKRALRLLGAVAVLFHMAVAFGDGTFPSKPITIVVPYPPGSVTDVRVRQLTDLATRQSGWKFLIDNRAGAMGTIGASYVAKAKPDGYTLLAGSSSELNLVPAYGMKLDFDSQKNLRPILQTVRGYMILVVPSSLGVNSFQELLALARKSAEPLSYGNAGPGSLTFVAGKLLEKKAGLTFTDVPYKSASQALLDLIPGRIQFQFDFIATSIAHIRDGKLKPLLITSQKRAPLLPNVPTATEAGYPDLAISVVAGFFSPQGTPDTIVLNLQKIFAAAVRAPEIERAYADAGNEAIGGSSQEFATVMTEDRKRWNEIIGITGIHAE